MAKFVLNSTNTKAVRASTVSAVEVAERTSEVGEEITYSYIVTLFTEGIQRSIVFEGGSTLQQAQQKAATVLAALEAAI